ncbi:hypothetical protein [Sporosarcina sp. USHLN248]|uniref:hypothetical protein n=1 Tax=Sporosarcina sp. USHLN248 TaxID=3081300 RepID=UPI00301919CE
MSTKESKELLSEHLGRLENNHYAIEKSRVRLDAAIERRDNKEIYTAIGELLLWTLTTEEWHWKHNKTLNKRRNRNKNGQVLLGLRFAYNAMKHNMNFYEIHYDNTKGFSFPFSFPIHFEIKNILWVKTDEKFEYTNDFHNVKEENYKKQLSNYRRYIEGKDVSITFDKAIEFLREEYERIK